MTFVFPVFLLSLAMPSHFHLWTPLSQLILQMFVSLRAVPSASSLLFLLLLGKLYHLLISITIWNLISQILSLFQIFLLSFRLKKNQNVLPTHQVCVNIPWVPPTQHQQTELSSLYYSSHLPESQDQPPSLQEAGVRWGVDRYNLLNWLHSLR